MMDKFCKFCGEEHVADEYPKQCFVCKAITWVNPTPVAVLLQPVTDGIRTGILIGKRGIEPQKGNWGLPGGFVDPTDKSIEHAATRELWEETGAKVHPEFLKLVGSYCTGRQMLVFARSEQVLLWRSVEKNFVSNHECPEIDVAWAPRELCFESHTKFLAGYFSSSIEA